MVSQISISIYFCGRWRPADILKVTVSIFMLKCSKYTPKSWIYISKTFSLKFNSFMEGKDYLRPVHTRCFSNVAHTNFNFVIFWDTNMKFVTWGYSMHSSWLTYLFVLCTFRYHRICLHLEFLSGTPVFLSFIW